MTPLGAAPGEGDVFLTGASGFVGSHVLRALLARGYRVRALLRGPEPLPRGVVHVRGDLRTPAALVPALRGCRYIVHTAALYSFSPRDVTTIAEVNVAGTQGLLEAARIAGIERCVVTSSSSALAPATASRPVTERSWAESQPGEVSYHASKLLQERAALRATTPVITVLPTAPIGPGDHRPTPTGKIIVDLLRGRMPATLRGGMNVVAVEDVAAAHVLALEHGELRERYILGGVNLSLAELWRLVARAAGRPARVVPLPYMVAAVAAHADDLRVRVVGGNPAVPLEGVHMGRLDMYSSSAKAIHELGYRPSSVSAAIHRAVRWYREHGYAA
ncbi:MAG TPA: NAD-dependent epimerase/dehydratase family protein [Candidatus Saccharimonadales bacterium]|nr:NAD-dependent epimerase/dehydratase family protein [Candidatus Saccharimonadales bacterium]